MINPQTGDISGIDNDLSFGHDYAAKAKTGEGANTHYFAPGWGGVDEKYLGLPSQIDKGTAKTLLNLTPKKLEKMLNPKGADPDTKMNLEELQQTYDRLARIQQEVKAKKENGALITRWDDNTYDAAVNEAKYDNGAYRNYIQRQEANVAKAKDTNNPLQWRPGRRAQDAPGSLPQPAPAQPAPAQPAPAQAQTPAPAWENANKAGGRARSGLKAGGNRRRPAPNRSLPPLPPNGRSLSDRVADTPWARDFRRTKQRV